VIIMDWRRLEQQRGRVDPRAAVTWLGAAVVLGCGLWLSFRGGPAAVGLPAHLGPAGELREEVAWIDQRLSAEEGPGAPNDARRACRVASLHWDRATRLTQHEYNHRFGLLWMEGKDEDYGTFRRQYLKSDTSGDVAATLEAAQRALALLPSGPERVRPLWFLSLASSASGRWDEAIGALVEVTCYKPRQAWVWRLLAESYRARGDAARQELAEEQAWRISSGRPGSPYIAAVIRHTPYARPAARPAG
jgi:tetratricopeptide (TPR) repeat protein